MPGLISAMQGFCVIGIVIAVGYVAARMRIGGPSAQMVLNRFSFFVSSPCLMFAILSKEPIFDIFHPSIIVAFFSAVLVGVVFLVLNRMFFHLNAPDATIVGHWKTMEEVPAESDLSRQISRELKKRGASFVGPVIIYSFLQAVGIVNDHLEGCLCRKDR